MYLTVNSGLVALQFVLPAGGILAEIAPERFLLVVYDPDVTA